MTSKEQKAFTRELIGNVETEIMKLFKSKKIPADWEGIELRWLIADRYAAVVFGIIGKRTGKRYRSYFNETIINNLLT